MKQFQSIARGVKIQEANKAQIGYMFLHSMLNHEDLPMKSENLADPASQKPDLEGSGVIDDVGMSKIEVPILLQSQSGQNFRTAAKVDAFVNLNSGDSRGIHMSRLYNEVQATLPNEILSFSVLDRVLQNFLLSHEGLSTVAKISVAYEALLERKALKSQNTGYRTYPVIMSAELHKNQKPKHFLEVQIIYSSTCPASAALARQLIQDNFKKDFRNNEIDFKNIYDWIGTSRGISATPHAQRSLALVKVEILAPYEVTSLIDLIEDALQTPVQAAVKREDEQEFALRNGQNLMFCEDSARRMQLALAKNPRIGAFRAEARHMESLHPHDAVSVVRRGNA